MISCVHSRHETWLIPDDRTHVLADKVWPEENRHETFAKGEIEKADREEPPREPGESCEAMILDFYLVHTSLLTNYIHLRHCHYTPCRYPKLSHPLGR